MDAVPAALDAFLDADALIAGCASREGAAHVVLRLVEAGLIFGRSSEQVRTEVRRNLARKFPARLQIWERDVESLIHWEADPSKAACKPWAGQADDKDLPILVAAARAGARFLVTFNVRHFNPIEGPIIVTPGELLERLRVHISLME